jgi:hypothetical protein
VLAAFGYTAATVYWEARLTTGDHSWLLYWGRHSVWRPPPPPDFERFRQEFADSRPGVITVSFEPMDVVLGGLLRATPIGLGCGFAYLAFRGPRQDLVLHTALFVSGGLLVSAAACLCLWCVTGGWGPPLVGLLTVAGLAGGLWLGVGSFDLADSI